MRSIDTGSVGCGLAMLAIASGMAHDITQHSGGILHGIVLVSSIVLAAAWFWRSFNVLRDHKEKP